MTSQVRLHCQECLKYNPRDETGDELDKVDQVARQVLANTLRTSDQNVLFIQRQKVDWPEGAGWQIIYQCRERQFCIHAIPTEERYRFTIHLRESILVPLLNRVNCTIL